MINGNPRIANKVALLLAFAATAEINVNVIEKPKLPKKIANKNIPVSRTGLPTNKLNAAYDNKLKLMSKIVLYNILERITDCGLTKV